jgi:hypoxanthine phosphoribosyltransferase
MDISGGLTIFPKNSNHNMHPKDKERLMALIISLKSYRNNLQYVDYKQAEKDCEILACKILEIYSLEELKSFFFKAIPRGGLIVLGMLSYALDLKPSQFEHPTDPKQPVMIVDDIVLTGARISKILSKTNSSHVVIANLYSHPDLRRAILKKESNVKYCFAAHDLKDRSRENHHHDYHAWRKQMEEHIGKRYWIGEVDLVGFAWSETDYSFWNPVTEKLEDGWRSLPPHKCLKNKSLLRIPPTEPVEKDFHISSSVIMGLFHDEILLLQKDTTQIYSLSGRAAEIFRVLVAYGNIESSLKYLIKQNDVEDSVLCRDLKKYVNDLLKNKILEKEAD